VVMNCELFELLKGGGVRCSDSSSSSLVFFCIVCLSVSRGQNAPERKRGPSRCRK
jgi:hypothetical protein